MNDQEVASTAVRRALPVFEKINELYMTASAIMQRVDIADAATFDPAKRKGKAKLYTLIAFFVLHTIWALFMAVVDLVHRILPFLNFSFGFFFWGILGMAVVAIILYLFYQTILHGTSKEHEESKQARENANRQVEAISADVLQIFQDNEEIIAQIPRDYRNYDAVSYFEKVFANGQARTWREAMMLYDNHVHCRTLECGNARLQNIARQQSAMMANMEQMEQEAARNARIATGFSILSFLILVQAADDR